MQLRSIILFIVFLTISLSAIGQISIKATVDSTGMLIGDQQQLHLTIQHPQSAEVQSFYTSALDTIDNLEIITESPWDTTGTDPLTIRKGITFTIFDSGYYYIPRIAHSMILNGDTSLHFSNNIPIAVSTITTSDSTSLAPIREIKEEPLTFEDFKNYLYGLFGLLIIGFVIYKLIKKSNSDNNIDVETVVKEIVPAHEIALEKLASLKKKELWQNGQSKEYHSELTYIVREYLENRYNISALESSTHEILEDLKKVDFDDRFKNNLTEMLSIADLVKFAKAESTGDINTRIIHEAEEFVNTTKIIAQDS